MSKAKWLDRTVVRGPRLILCTTEKQFLKAVKAIGVINDYAFCDRNEACVHTFDEDWGMACLVCMPIDKDRSVAVTASIVAHEATHVAQRFFLRIGEDYPSKEFQAYVVENITRELMEDYMRQSNG